MKKLLAFGALLSLAACAGQQPPTVTTVCADLAPLQPIIAELQVLVPNQAVYVALKVAQSLENGACLNPQQLQQIIDQLNAVIAKQHAALHR